MVDIRLRSLLTTFTTNGTEWYSLNDLGTLSFQITVTYLGHHYNLTMYLASSTSTCETLYLPSGNMVGVTSSGGPCDSSNASGTTTTQAETAITWGTGTASRGHQIFWATTKHSSGAP
ncbi:MAG: hypothetical protein OK456_08435 [Thaumarchaeota archaeon]|nr:hypothetical protein [Nitrososphaerota archaeon]